ncbi:hypothetical protein HAX54_021771 [Datura stramonium]|uniref:Uncharacterized protein n=1 Tax=Datura stramonium TaxID=4076 RepID=A0ABS8UTD9_DATST|nr:hypothetical protein [Datura stramonium]
MARINGRIAIRSLLRTRQQRQARRTGYSGREQRNWRNKGLPPSNSRDEKIEAILSLVLTKRESIKSGVNKMHEELSSTGSTVEENNLGPTEAREEPRKLYDLRIEKCDAPADQSKETRDVPQDRGSEHHDASLYQCIEARSVLLDGHTEAYDTGNKLARGVDCRGK